MNRSLRARFDARVLARLAVAGGLAVAAVATGLPLALDLLPETAGAREALVPLPLNGTWRTMANGDRVNHIEVEGEVAWVAAEAGGVVRWDLDSGSYDQYLAPQDGLPSNAVREVEFTPDGTLWAATARGLARFDSVADRFYPITPELSPGMPARVVNALAAADDGRLWVGFGQEWDKDMVDPRSREPGTFKPGGLALYNPADGTWVETYNVEHTGEWTNPTFATIPSENVMQLEFATDGILWIGTEPYWVWDANTCNDADCPPEPGYWVPAGGGLAAKLGDQWQFWHAGQASVGGCYSNIIRDLAPDDDGFMWVAASDGLLVMRHGLTRVGCDAQVRYTRARREAPGMLGRSVFSVLVDGQNKVWVGQAEGRRKGLGLGLLDHAGTLDDFNDWNSDDLWEFYDVDGASGDTDLLISEMAYTASGRLIIGTINNRLGDGDGLRLFEPAAGRWTPFRTSADGLPSNQIVDVKPNPVTGDLWVTTQYRGVARFDGEHWQSWRMFGAGPEVARSTVDAFAGVASIPVDFEGTAEYQAAFPTHPRYMRLGTDTTLYRITGYTLSTGAIRITPKLTRPTPRGTPIYVIDRGPASDLATQIAIDDAGDVWVGGRESIWLGECSTYPHCWLDGGLGHWDGEAWEVHSLTKDETGLEVQDQEVQSVEIDDQGRIWAGTGDPFEGLDGKGIFVFSPPSNSWTLFDTKTVGNNDFGGNGIADMDKDPDTGDVWVAHHSTEICDTTSPFGGDCKPTFAGGGVSHWDGESWMRWTKRTGATIRAAGRDGEMSAIAVDRERDLVWAGSFDDSSSSFHWLQGKGVNAVINWCPLNCSAEAWEHKLWEEEGEVAAIEMDDTGNLWVGIHRYGHGDIPPEAGIKVYDGQDWSGYTPANSGLPSNEVTVLQREDDTMWVGTLKHGLAQYSPVLQPTPTPRATNTPRPSSTPTEPSTVEPTPTLPLTPGTAVATSTEARATATRATPVSGSCGNGGPCYAFVPMALQKRLCGRNCPTPVPPTATRASAMSPTPTQVPGETATATGAVSPTPSVTLIRPSETPVATSTPTATATAAGPTSTDAPTATSTQPPTATVSPTATHTRTPFATPTDQATAVPTSPPILDWREYNGTVPRDSFNSVHGLDAAHVWMVGERSQVLFFDGNQMYQQQDVIPPDEILRKVFMSTPDRGYIVGDDGLFMETRDGGQLWRNTRNVESYIDDWWGISMVAVDRGYRGWALGNLNGNRIYYDGIEWSAPSPADRNNRTHHYADVAVLSDALAFAIQDGSTGSRIYKWEGDQWSPGPATGPLKDMHVLSSTEGVAVGDRGSFWFLNGDGEWEKGAGPQTSGQHLYAVHMESPHRVWAAGGRGKIYVYNGVEWNERSVSGNIQTIRSLWITPAGDDGWAVGENGQFLRYGAGAGP